MHAAYFYPRSPCGERLHYDNYNLHCVEISIHALLAESDERKSHRRIRPERFLSTLSLRRATTHPIGILVRVVISIHALLAESDGPRQIVIVIIDNFYPRSPCGERQVKLNRTASRITFLSTLSLRRATGYQRPCGHPTTDFYPRSPCGERRSGHPETRLPCAISIHALLAESDGRVCQRNKLQDDFYPRSPCGERLKKEQKNIACSVFLSTLSLRRATSLR